MAKKRYSIDLKDVRAVILECAKCGATMGFSTSQWNSAPLGCSNCRGVESRDATAHQMYDSLRVSLADLTRVYTKLPFRVRFEFNGLEETEQAEV
ncbi:MAG: hypothetical protein WD733_24890 [Bryobacterales bacterium]